MHTEVQKQNVKGIPKKVIVISLVAFILLTLAVAAQLSFMVIKYDGIYKGVYINDIYVGNLTPQEATDLLNTAYQDKISKLEITLKSGSSSEKIKFSDININFDIPTAVDKAYNIGRTGNVLERFSEIIKARRGNPVLDVSISFDRQKVESIIQSLYDKTFKSVKEADLLIQDNRVIIRSGHHGENIDKDITFKEVENFISQHKGGEIDIPLIITAPSKINVSDYMSQINREMQDAYAKVENNNVTIVPEVVGRSINKTDLIAIADYLEKNENTEKILPVNFIKPSVTIADVQNRLFKDTLYITNTQFNTSTQNNLNRSENIRLAAEKINGKILAPGEVFSFNDTVGPRTEEAGYKDAYTFVAGKVVPGLGGGICQVSTTLYNAVLHSDLDIVERRNHMFVVSYAPYGQDATVAYGSVDFRFKNSTSWPIKIDCWITKDNKLYFALKGTNEAQGKTVEIVSKIRQTTDFKTKYIDDPALPEGQTKVTHTGSKGYIVDTYKITKQDGKVIESIKISTSVYRPLDEEVHRGTKKEGAPSSPPHPPQKVEPGIDDADNPPAEVAPTQNESTPITDNNSSTPG